MAATEDRVIGQDFVREFLLDLGLMYRTPSDSIASKIRWDLFRDMADIIVDEDSTDDEMREILFDRLVKLLDDPLAWTHGHMLGFVSDFIGDLCDPDSGYFPSECDEMLMELEFDHLVEGGLV
jgi:hypothetical protein